MLAKLGVEAGLAGRVRSLRPLLWASLGVWFLGSVWPLEGPQRPDQTSKIGLDPHAAITHVGLTKVDKTAQHAVAMKRPATSMKNVKSESKADAWAAVRRIATKWDPGEAKKEKMPETDKVENEYAEEEDKEFDECVTEESRRLRCVRWEPVLRESGWHRTNLVPISFSSHRRRRRQDQISIGRISSDIARNSRRKDSHRVHLSLRQEDGAVDFDSVLRDNLDEPR